MSTAISLPTSSIVVIEDFDFELEAMEGHEANAIVISPSDEEDSNFEIPHHEIIGADENDEFVMSDPDDETEDEILMNEPDGETNDE